jgi:uncharacterized RDD family membrane protein YckC
MTEHAAQAEISLEQRKQDPSGGPGTTAGSTGAEVRVRVAGLWRRLLATAVDGLILSPLLLLLAWLAFRVTGLGLPVGRDLRPESILELFLEGGSLLYGLIGTGLVIVLLYGVLFMGTTGATPGLRLLRLRVINLYGDSPEWWRMALRCLGFLISVLLLGLGFLWIGFDREKRCLHDWLAGTYVIRCGRSPRVATTHCEAAPG